MCTKRIYVYVYIYIYDASSTHKRSLFTYCVCTHDIIILGYGGGRGHDGATEQRIYNAHPSKYIIYYMHNVIRKRSHGGHTHLMTLHRMNIAYCLNIFDT